MSFSLGEDVRCESIKLNSVEAYDRTTGIVGDVLTADGSGKCSWAVAGTGGVSNPLSADLQDGGFNIIGNGLIKNDGLELNNTGNDNLPVSSIYTGSLYKLQLSTGSVGQLAYQNAFDNSSTSFPTNSTNINFCNGLPIFGPSVWGNINGTGIVVGGSADGVLGSVVGGLDQIYYDPCNCRGGLVANDYKDFCLTRNLPGCDGSWGAGVARGVLKIEAQFQVDFSAITNNEFQLVLNQYNTQNITTGVRGTLKNTWDIFNETNDMDNFKSSCVYYLRLYDGLGIIGDSFGLTAKIPVGSSNGGDINVDYQFTWSPTP